MKRKKESCRQWQGAGYLRTCTASDTESYERKKTAAWRKQRAGKLVTSKVYVTKRCNSSALQQLWKFFCFAHEPWGQRGSMKLKNNAVQCNHVRLIFLKNKGPKKPDIRTWETANYQMWTINNSFLKKTPAFNFLSIFESQRRRSRKHTDALKGSRKAENVFGKVKGLRERRRRTHSGVPRSLMSILQPEDYEQTNKIPSRQKLSSVAIRTKKVQKKMPAF